jgi:hypothetical protein
MRRADYATTLCQQKLALTSAASDGRWVGIVRSRIQATEFCLFFVFVLLCHNMLKNIDKSRENREVAEVLMASQAGLCFTGRLVT